MDQYVVGIAQDIRDMKIRGAGRIARAGADAIGRFAENYASNDMQQFRTDLDEAVKIILDYKIFIQMVEGRENAVV